MSLFSNRAHRSKQRRSARRPRAVSFDILEVRRLLATIVRDVPEYNGQEFGESTAFPLPPVQVGTISFSQELQGSTVTSATISGTFGNSTIPHSAGVRVFLDGIQIAETASFDQPPPVTWSHTFSGPELAVLQDGVAELTAVQTSRIAIRLGETRLQVTTSATPPNPPFVPSVGPPPTAIPAPSSPLTPGISAPAAVGHDGEPGDIRAEAIDLGAITTSIFVEDEISDVNDIDFYTFTAVRDQIITFDIDAPGLDSFLKITAPGSKRTIAGNNNGRSEELEELLGPLGDDSFVRFVAPADGTYFLAVSNFRYAIPYDPDTVEGRDFRGDPRLPETGAYRLVIRTPNIRAGALKVESSQRNPRNFTLTVTFEVREANIDPRLFFSINNLGNATPILRGPINQRDTNGIPTNLIGSHTVVFDIPVSVLTGNTAQFLNLDPPFGRNDRGVTIETDEFDNTSLVTYENREFNIEDIPSIEINRGWVNGARLLSRWFRGTATVAPNYASPPSYVDMSFVLEPRRSRITLALLKKDYIAASSRPFTAVEARLRTQLIARAKRLLAGSTQNTVQLTDFQTAGRDIITGELLATPDYHGTQHLGFRPVLPLVNPLTFKGDDQYAALGNHSLYAAPIGTVTASGNFATVTITGIAVHLRDSFDFEAGQSFELGLRYWKLPDGWSFTEKPGYTFVDNPDFRAYRSRTGRGSDFEVYSDIRIENFERPRSFTFPL